MSELYTVTAEEGRLRFLPRTDAALEQAVLDESPLPGCEFVSRLGDPGLLHCVGVAKVLSTMRGTPFL